VIPIRERSGAVTGAVVVFKDISTIKELERLRKEWTSIVAHDLRQPLALISMNSALLATKVDSPEQQKRIARILDSVGRLNRMIADLLDLSRLEVKDLPLAREELDPGPFVQAVVDRARDTIGEREIRVSVSASLPHVQADPGRVEQILTNLLTNAAKYGENGTPIDVTVDHTDSEVVIAVTNRGPGIAPEDLPNLFQRFKRAERTHRKGVESIGLGLYITKGLVESHGGRIWAESIPGAETTFTLTLPQSASQVT
jgi:signal transduction histidine kinase